MNPEEIEYSLKRRCTRTPPHGFCYDGLFNALPGSASPSDICVMCCGTGTDWTFSSADISRRGAKAKALYNSGKLPPYTLEELDLEP